MRVLFSNRTIGVASFVIFLLTVTVPISAIGESPSPKKKAARQETLIVWDLVPEKDVQKGAANLLTEMILDYATKLGRFEVMGNKDLSKILNWEQQKQLQGCTDSGCMINLAGAMGAKYIVEGSLGIMGDQYMVTIKLIDVSVVKVLSRETRRAANDEKLLIKTVDEMLPVVFKDIAPNPSQEQAQLTVRQQLAKNHGWRNGTLISGGVMLGLGITFNILGAVESGKYGNAGSPQEANDIQSKVNVYNALMITGYAAGGALMVTGIVLYILEPKGEAAKKLSGLGITTLPGGMGLSYGGSW